LYGRRVLCLQRCFEVLHIGQGCACAQCEAECRERQSGQKVITQKVSGHFLVDIFVSGFKRWLLFNCKQVGVRFILPLNTIYSSD
jgi:hypothetical protein